ncbi:hypothetical protein CALCODRAFT_503031 [Calocera cornea HHB12733]|uniref:Uncharacterized protein n=1 Tax=Calocera cornea HHB12733 TaxID=1353952 RepID=A0A165D148_9BASI|nr:hypothetical protein CALCODRAFT_503031 [Calocera cornea HHB12733]
MAPSGVHCGVRYYGWQPRPSDRGSGGERAHPLRVSVWEAPSVHGVPLTLFIFQSPLSTAQQPPRSQQHDNSPHTHTHTHTAVPVHSIAPQSTSISDIPEPIPIPAWAGSIPRARSADQDICARPFHAAHSCTSYPTARAVIPSSRLTAHQSLLLARSER